MFSTTTQLKAWTQFDQIVNADLIYFKENIWARNAKKVQECKLKTVYGIKCLRAKKENQSLSL